MLAVLLKRLIDVVKISNSFVSQASSMRVTDDNDDNAYDVDITCIYYIYFKPFTCANAVKMSEILRI